MDYKSDKKILKSHNCNGSFNEKLIISATNYARETIGITKSLWVFINNCIMFKSIDHSGMYDKENFLIRYNRDWLKNADHKQIIKCAFHEVFHVVQHDALNNWKSGNVSLIFSDEELRQIEIEFNDYNYSDSIHKWNSYFIEQQAECFAEILYKRFQAEKIKLRDLVTRYYNKYLNEN